MSRDLSEAIEEHLPGEERSRFHPRVRVDTSSSAAAGQAGGVLLIDTVAGPDADLSAALARWRKPLAVHDPGKVVLDLAVSLVLGGDCLADIALLRSEPGVYGPVASDSTVSRTIDALAADAPAALKALDTARAAPRARVWALAGEHAPDHNGNAAAPLVIDIDATLVTAHSEKERAAPTFKRGSGFHPLWTFVDRGPAGSGNRLRCWCGRATPGRTPPPTTPRCLGRRTHRTARPVRLAGGACG